MDQKQAVVIGGGKVAQRKVEELLQADASIKVISPNICPPLAKLIQENNIQTVCRSYQPGDLEGASLVIAATNDTSINRAIYEEARSRNLLVNVVDDPAHSNFILPAIFHRGQIGVAISTGGASPALARRLREKLEKVIGPEYADLAELLSEMRPELMQQFEAGEARLEAALKIIDSPILEILAHEGRAAAQNYARRLWSDEPASNPPPSLPSPSHL